LKTVVNSTPLIALSITGYLFLLNRLFDQVVVPISVYEEVALQGEERPGAEAVAQANWLVIQAPERSLLLGDISHAEWSPQRSGGTKRSITIAPLPVIFGQWEILQLPAGVVRQIGNVARYRRQVPVYDPSNRLRLNRFYSGRRGDSWCVVLRESSGKL